jgi:hypothetical protein
MTVSALISQGQTVKLELFLGILVVIGARKSSCSGGHRTGADHTARLFVSLYNFSPPGTTQEFEDYTLDLTGVSAFELRIVPDISGGEARASVNRLRLA